ncbi:MAG TPA: minichromosome maintenance protein MCM [Candidatus Baltobacteraceae bacterium]|nr:minichromosome maintenance protein MCM [Candidatus Baltobacteraceae bacterium]
MGSADEESMKRKFDEFLESYYKEAIEELAISFPDKTSIMVDIKDLSKFDPEIASELIQNPDPILEAAAIALKDKLVDTDLKGKEPRVRFFGQTVNNPLVMDVGSNYIGKLILLDGLIVKRSEINPKVKVGFYKCTYCGATYKLRIDKDEVPEICDQCKRKSLRQDPKESQFINLQKIAVQDPLERLKGNTPTWQLEVWIEDDLVNTVIPGDRIELTGILRIRPRKNSRGKTERNIYTMFLETVSKVPRQKEFTDIPISDEEERQIRELAGDPLVFEKIAKSIAPSIYGFEEIKQAVTLQLFGGTPGKTLVDGAPVRSDMHILLIGDPGSAKTRVLQAVSRLVPKGIYVSGKSVTGGGMTAVAERDEFSEGGWTLKAGALVLGSGGIVAIDEFDKIGEEDRAALHEALESQTISVAKAGIIATFTARAAVLAAANPKYGRFDPNIYPSEQFDIPPTLLSRFDLIFPIKDVMDEELDRNIAKHILLQHGAAGAKIMELKEYDQVEAPPIEMELIRKFIAYAKKNVHPRLMQEASDKIQNYYIELRKIGAKTGVVPITPRQIEGLIRMAEASAKSRLGDSVLVSDAERAIYLSEYMLKTLAVDRSGRRDIDILSTGMPREKVNRINSIMTIIKKLEEEEGGMGAKMQRLVEEAVKENIDEQTLNKYLGELERSGDIFRPRPGIVKTIRHESE